MVTPQREGEEDSALNPSQSSLFCEQVVQLCLVFRVPGRDAEMWQNGASG